MKRTILSALALAAMTTAAAAEPRAMSEDQLAGVAAGFVTVTQGITQDQVANVLALDLGTLGGASAAISQTQNAATAATDTVTEMTEVVLPPTPASTSPIGGFLPVQ